MPSISVLNVRYGPNPLYVRQGGSMHYLFDVVFSDEPPAEFDYSVDIQTPDGTTVRTLAGRVATNGEQTVPVAIYTTPTTDLGAPLPFGHYKNIFNVSEVAEGGEMMALSSTSYPPYSERICSGINPTPEPSTNCPI